MPGLTYIDTRGRNASCPDFGEVIRRGTAPGGGLYVPEHLPRFEPGELLEPVPLPYPERAGFVLERFATSLPTARLEAAVAAAYGSQWDHPAVTPVVEGRDGLHLLELWHGPTGAFKDVALQLLPHLLSAVLEPPEAGGDRGGDLLILTATSGDTGGAALAGFADHPRVRLAVFFPQEGVSEFQRRQMVSSPGRNVTVVGVRGHFDDCQRLVKGVLGDAGFAARLHREHGLSLSSANSINWGRLLPQIVYYAGAWADLAARGALPPDGRVDVCVPTGNFGNILAAWYARRMGVPIGRLLCASNDNHVLSDFLAGGVYDLTGRILLPTPSPAMDILVSSNLERLLFDMSGDGKRIRGWMAELASTGRFTVDPATCDGLREVFTGDWVSAPECLATIREVWEARGRLLDPHTAVAWRVAERHRGSNPVLVVGTAHWAKFAPDVLRALRGEPPNRRLPSSEEDPFGALAAVQALTGDLPLPPALTALADRPVRFERAIEATPEAVQAFLQDSF
jgi:threonine synthase